MSDYSGKTQRDVVKIRVLKTGKGSWYADQVGRVVKAMREITVDDDGVQWADYSQYPPARGFEPSGHYVGYEIEEVK